MPVNTETLPQISDVLKAWRHSEGAEKKMVSYKLVADLGKGAFGAVFKAQCVEDGKLYAVKCEPIVCRKAMLKLELQVVRRGRSSGSPYFTDYGDRGVEPKRYSFFTMQLVDKNLWDLLRDTAGFCFSLSTACRVADQTLAGVRDLHAVGYVHRDLKPANFAVGRREDSKDSIIYILDFGLCRKYRNAANKVKKPREKVLFRGTTRYASLGALSGEDQSRKDDLESWFYMNLEFTQGLLPWNKDKERDANKKKKQEFRQTGALEEFMKDGPAAEFKKMFEYIISMTYLSVPDYDFLHQTINKLFDSRDFRDQEPFEWSPTRIYEGPGWDCSKYVKIKDRYTPLPNDKEKDNSESSKVDNSANEVNEDKPTVRLPRVVKTGHPMPSKIVQVEGPSIKQVSKPVSDKGKKTSVPAKQSTKEKDKGVSKEVSKVVTAALPSVKKKS